MKNIVASLILLGSFSMATAEPLNPTPEPLDQNTMHKILRSFNDLKVQDFAAWENKMVDLCEGKKSAIACLYYSDQLAFAANNPERIKKAAYYAEMSCEMGNGDGCFARLQLDNQWAPLSKEKSKRYEKIVQKTYGGK